MSKPIHPLYYLYFFWLYGLWLQPESLFLQGLLPLLTAFVRLLYHLGCCPASSVKGQYDPWVIATESPKGWFCETHLLNWTLWGCLIQRKLRGSLFFNKCSRWWSCTLKFETTVLIYSCLYHSFQEVCSDSSLEKHSGTQCAPYPGLRFWVRVRLWVRVTLGSAESALSQWTQEHPGTDAWPSLSSCHPGSSWVHVLLWHFKILRILFCFVYFYKYLGELSFFSFYHSTSNFSRWYRNCITMSHQPLLFPSHFTPQDVLGVGWPKPYPDKRPWIQELAQSHHWLSMSRYLLGQVGERG